MNGCAAGSVVGMVGITAIVSPVGSAGSCRHASAGTNAAAGGCEFPDTPHASFGRASVQPSTVLDDGQRMTYSTAMPWPPFAASDTMKLATPGSSVNWNGVGTQVPAV